MIKTTHAARKTTSQRFSAIAMALSMALLTTSARAQLPDSLAGVGTLLQQLGQMQQRGSGLSLDSGRFTSQLDASRARGGAVMAGPMGFGSTATDQLLLREALIQKRTSLQIACSNLGRASEEAMRVARAAGDISDLEADYCFRTGLVLPQYGYDNFSPADLMSAASAMGGPQRQPISGAVQEDYRLGPGDELVITIMGTETRAVTITIDTEGRAIIPQMRPIPAAGRTLAEFRRDVLAQIALSMPRAEVLISVGAIRSVRVIVAGEVTRPGLLPLTGLSSVVDALQAAGGVKKSGSLRRIRLERRNQVTWIDLYDLLLNSGIASDIQLNDGDRIIVPAIGATVGIGGNVKRPGIYELAEGRRSVMLADALQLAGGPIRPRGIKNLHIGFDASGKQVVEERADGTSAIGDGDIVTVVYSENAQTGSVELAGHVAAPGRRSLAAAPSVRVLIGSRDNLKPDPYVPFAALETVDESTRSRRFVPINLEKVLLGYEDIALKESDRLIVFSNEDIRFLSSLDVIKTLRLRQSENTRSALDQSQAAILRSSGGGGDPLSQLGGSVPGSATPGGVTTFPLVTPPAGSAISGSQVGAATSVPLQLQAGTSAQGQSSTSRAPDAKDAASARTCKGLDALANVINSSRTERFFPVSTGLGSESERLNIGYRTCPPIFDLFEYLLPFVLEYVAVVTGEVRQPGAFPVLSGTPLSSLTALAGGISGLADLTQVEISRNSLNPIAGTAVVERRTHNVGQSGLQSIATNPGDIIRFNATGSDRDSGPVLLSGEIVRPGLYDIKRGERLSELIARAGGMTPSAYPYGAIFTRESVRQSQRLALRRAARELNSAILYSAGQKSINPAGMQQATLISQQLEEIEAIGRVVIEADIAVLQARPDLDIVLEPGDRLFMPKRPSFVMIAGDVLNPGAQQFIAGKRADTYIVQAGGFQRSADEDRTFIVYPNGEAKPLKLSAWNYTPTQVPPGSTLIVPKEPAPFDLFTAVKDTTALVGQLAITAASLAVINRN